MTSEGGVHFHMSRFSAGILTAVLAALTLSVIYTGFSIRDQVIANTSVAGRALETALAVQSSKADEDDVDKEVRRLDSRMNSVETRVQMLGDRISRRGVPAFWHPPLQLPPEPTPPRRFIADQKVIKPKALYLAWGDA